MVKIYELEGETVKGNTHLLYFKSFEDFKELAERLNVPIFKFTAKEGIIRKITVTYYFFYAGEVILCIYYEPKVRR